MASRLAIVLASVLALALLFGLTALSAVVVVMPLLVALQLFRHRDKARLILSQTRDAMHTTADDLVVITAAMLVAFFATQDGGLASLVAGIYPGQFPGWLALVATPVMSMVAVMPPAETVRVSLSSKVPLRVNWAWVALPVVVLRLAEIGAREETWS